MKVGGKKTIPEHRWWTWALPVSPVQQSSHLYANNKDNKVYTVSPDKRKHPKLVVLGKPPCQRPFKRCSQPGQNRRSLLERRRNVFQETLNKSSFYPSDVLNCLTDATPSLSRRIFLRVVFFLSRFFIPKIPTFSLHFEMDNASNCVRV